jgi:signal transduction histidine kinase
LSNAVKFTEKGIITVAVELQPEDWVEIRISDTGIGIGQDDQSLLFGSFVRLESHLKIGTPGTGLGLYLTKKLATEVLAGEVAAVSREGEGSTFILRIPRYLQIDHTHESPETHERRHLKELTELEAVGTLPANSRARDKHDTADQ